MSDGDTSSANPAALEAFVNTAMQLDARLALGAVSLRAAIAEFTASCREYPTGIDESLADQLQDLARRNTEMSLCVRQVAEQFTQADTGLLDPPTTQALVQDPLLHAAVYQGLIDGLRSTVQGGPDDLAAGLAGTPITEASLDVLVDGGAQASPRDGQAAPAEGDDPSLQAASVAPAATGGWPTDTGPLDALGQWTGYVVRSVQAGVTETQAEVRDDLNAVGVAKDQFIADHPLPFQVAGDAGAAAVRAASAPGSIANCDQARMMVVQAGAALRQNDTPENRVALGEAVAAQAAACGSQPMAQTRIETPFGPTFGMSSPFDKGGWDSVVNNHGALGGHDEAPPGWLSQSDGTAGGDLGLVDASVNGASRATAAGDLGVVGPSVNGASDAVAADGAVGTRSMAEWDRLIAQAKQESPARADEVRYQRDSQAKAAEGKPPLDQNTWQVKVDQLRANAASGRFSEDRALLRANVPNNNYGKVVLIPDGQGSFIRPDGMTDSAIIDVKSTDQPVIYYTEQLKLEQQAGQAE